jgi:hypothetical protein
MPISRATGSVTLVLADRHKVMCLANIGACVTAMMLPFTGWFRAVQRQIGMGSILRGSKDGMRGTIHVYEGLTTKAEKRRC